MIPFIRDFQFEYGKVMRVSALVRRVVARNPGRFTHTGTGTLLVGSGDVVVIDPGPERDDHFDALNSALGGERLTHVLVTHNHMDHSALAKRLAEHHGAVLCGRAGPAPAADGGAVRQEAADDPHFRPDLELVDGWRLEGAGWSLRAVHTPGHTEEHFCFALDEEKTLFCGDHVMAWSTSVVTPPDGHMGRYMNSLEKVRSMNFDRLVPTHGSEIDDPGPFVAAYMEHRNARRRQILDMLLDGEATVRALVDSLYIGLSPTLRPAAALTVWAHLIHLVEDGLASAWPAASIDATYWAQLGSARS